MATRGRRPTPEHLKVVTNGRHLPTEETQAEGDAVTDGKDPLVPPKKLTKTQERLWDDYIASAWWLTHHDAPKAHAWVVLQAEFLRNPAKMVTARITQMRVLGSELGLDPGARERMGISYAKPTEAKKGVGKFLD